ncbi:MAG: LCP family protein [Actinobacteria bacterium]|nr:LCP family protein [Actinomycetota bacterium]
MSGDDWAGPVVRGAAGRGTLDPVRTPRREAPGGDDRPPGRGPRWWRLRHPSRRGALLLAGLVVLALAVYPVALGLYASSQIERVGVRGLSHSLGGMNVLVVGSDTRDSLTTAERRDLATGPAEGERTDTIFVLSSQGGRAAMLAFPRDLWVTRCDGSEGRINEAFAIGGPSCLAETVESLSGISLTNYMEVDFAGFVDLVEAVGGVRMCLDEPIQDPKAALDLPSGCQHLDAGESLGYVRVRDIDDDFGRIDRQQQFLRALAARVASPSTVLNPFRMFAIAGAGGRALRGDEGLGPIDLARLARGGRSIAGGAANTAHTVPAVPTYIGGAAVLVPVDREAEALFERFRDGSVLETGAPVRPRDVNVAVLNGTGEEGLASYAAAVLADRGFHVTRVGNGPPVDHTVVRYPGDLDEAAAAVAGELEAAGSVEIAGDGGRVTLVLGPDAALDR